METKIQLKDLKQPVWLIHPEIKNREKTTYMHYLQVATKLAIKEKSLVGCYLFDGSNHVYKIAEMKDLGNLNGPFKFEFFNPMRKIDLVLEQVSDQMILEKILNYMKNVSENNE